VRRSGGITASAVIAIIGSVLCLLFGGFFILVAILVRTMPNLPASPGRPVSPVVALAIQSVLYLGFGVWGLVSAVYLLKLKNWARICFQVFAGLLCASSAMLAMMILALRLLLPQMAPPQANVPPGTMAIVFGLFVFLALLQLALGIWWLVYFSRRHVKAQFLGEETVPTPSRRPLSITIIAWLFIVGGAFTPFHFFLSYPAVFFGFALRGRPAQLTYLLFGAICLLAGIGLLRMKPAAHSLAVVYYVFGLLNLTSSFLLPGSFARMQALLREMYPPGSAPEMELGEQFLRGAMLFAVLALAVPLWFLVTRRQAYLNACKASSSASPPGPGDSTSPSA